MPYLVQLKPSFPLNADRRRAGRLFVKDKPQFFQDDELTDGEIVAIQSDEWLVCKKITDQEYEKYKELLDGKRPDPDVEKPELSPEDDIELEDAMAEAGEATESVERGTEAQESAEPEKSAPRGAAARSKGSSSVSKAKKSGRGK